jgi:ribose 5-phosphate isomerase A
MDQDQLKREVAKASLKYVQDGMLLGVGTGSTVNCFIDLLAESGISIDAAVSSSDASTQKLRQIGVKVIDLNAAGPLEVYVDGADEVDPHRRLIKGGGGALTREKIIAGCSRRFICIVDESKQVDVLGRFPLPVEVIPMARSFVARKMIEAGGQPVYRDGFITDNGNHILDVHNLDLIDPVSTEAAFNAIPGIVTVGLFAHRGADVVLVASAAGVRQV